MAAVPATQKGANKHLTLDQQVFATVLAAQTHLDPTVVASWVLSENGGGGANGKNNFLGVGITGSGRYGASDAIWANPVSAGLHTAEWLKGQAGAVPGYGNSSSQIQAIAQTAGQPVAAQIAAIQYHGVGGWSTGGEVALPGAYATLKSAGGFNPLKGVDLANAMQGVGGLSVPPTGALGTPSGGGGPSSFTGVVGSAAGAVGSAASAIASPVTSVAGLIGDLTNPQLWIRVVEVLGGVVLIVLGLAQLSGTSLRGVAAKAAVL